MSTAIAFDLAGFSRATQERDARALVELYAEDAVVSVVDPDHRPAGPLVISGKAAIRTWIEDTCSRDMAHRVVNPVLGTDRVALMTECTYPDGSQVLCSCNAELQGGLITAQAVVQVWDD